jgi:hypothetical protein
MRRFVVPAFDSNYYPPPLAPPGILDCDFSGKKKVKRSFFPTVFCVGKAEVNGVAWHVGKGGQRRDCQRHTDTWARTTSNGWDKRAGGEAAGIPPSLPRGLSPTTTRRARPKVRLVCGTSPVPSRTPTRESRAQRQARVHGKSLYAPTPLGDPHMREYEGNNRGVCDATFTRHGLGTASSKAGPSGPTGHSGSNQRPGQPYTLSVSGGRGWGRRVRHLLGLRVLAGRLVTERRAR